MDGLNIMDSSEDEEFEGFWIHQLQESRLLLVENVEYERCSTALLSKGILDQDDDEEIQNRYVNSTSKKRMNVFLDKLMKKGSTNYTKFLEVLGTLYPSIYRVITNEEPVEIPDLIPKLDSLSSNLSSPSSLVLGEVFELLARKKDECEGLRTENLTLENQLDESQEEIQKLKDKNEEIEYKSSRYDTLLHEMSALRQVVDQVKTENHKLYRRLVDSLEETSQLRERVDALRLERDKQTVSLRQLQITVDSEKRTSVRLKNRLKSSPTENDINALMKQITELKVKYAEENTGLSCVTSENSENHLIVTLKKEREDAIKLWKENFEELSQLREKLYQSETFKEDLLSEIEQLRSQNTALHDDCDMYKARRDKLWESLQEVEKERDQAIKERNEAQLMAQTYMGEKAKYRIQIQNLEEQHDLQSRKLREQESQLLSMKQRMKFNTIKQRSRYAEKIRSFRRSQEEKRVETIKTPKEEPHFDFRRFVVRRRNRNQLGTTYTDGTPVDINLHPKVLLEEANFIGGNTQGFFIESLLDESSLKTLGLIPGLQIIKVTENGPIFNFTNSTLERCCDILKQFDNPITITVRYVKEEFEAIKSQHVESGCSGDSFYALCNFTFKRDGYLSLNKGDIIHIKDTAYSDERHWLGCMVDKYSGLDIGKPEKIPSYKYCVSCADGTDHRTSRPNSFILDLVQTMPWQQEFSSMSSFNDIGTCNQDGIPPYIIVEPLPNTDMIRRPCIFLPYDLSMLLTYKLTTIAEPIVFDFPVPEIITNNPSNLEDILKQDNILTYKTKDTSTIELMKPDAVRNVMRKNNHAIISHSNKDGHPLEKLIRRLHDNKIYPITVLLTTDKPKSIKSFMLQTQTHWNVNSHLQDIRDSNNTLQKLGIQFTSINLDRCSKIEDVMQQVIEKVPDENMKTIWRNATGSVYI